MANKLLGAWVIFSVFLHFFDQATDLFAAFLFLIEGRMLAGVLTLLFVLTPGIFVFGIELSRICSGKTNICKALAYLFLTPLWAIVIHFYSLCDERYLRTAFYFKTIEGFLEAGPQVALQLSLLFRGNWTRSDQLALEPILPVTAINATDVIPETDDLEVLGRVYDADSRHFFGHVHLFSVLLSFFSLLVTAIFFNEVEDKSIAAESASACCPPGLMARVAISVPFCLFTLLYRAIGISLMICFIRFWGGIVIFALFFLNVLSALYIGDNISRAISYGLWSIFIPAGFNRDPSSPLGYSKIPLLLEGHHISLMDVTPGGSPQIEPQDEISAKVINTRAKYFLTSHVLANVFLLAPCLVLTIILVQVDPVHLGVKPAFDLDLLNTVFLPVLGLCLGLSVLFARPYHRCECSGG